MMRLSLIGSVYLIATTPLHAQVDYQQLAEDAVNDAQVFTDYTHSGAEDVLNTQIDTDLPQTELDAPALEDAGILATQTNTVEAQTHSLIDTNITDWGIQAVDQNNLSLADQVADDPSIYADPSTFSASAAACTVTDFAASPSFTRSCDMQREMVTSTCTSVASITVLRTETYECNSNDPAAACNELNAASQCTMSASFCVAQDIDGNCIETEFEYVCSSDEPMIFAATQVGPTIFAPPVETWTTSCDVPYDAALCSTQTTSCTDGPTIINANDQMIPMTCVEETATASCLSPTFNSGCSLFESDPSCQLVDSFCVLDDAPDGCTDIENTYQCGSSGHQAFDASCEAVNVCVGGSCQSIPQETNNDIGKALASVDMLNTMASEAEFTANPYYAYFINGYLDSVEVSFFKPGQSSCRRTILSALNCCRDTGWANNVFANCKSSEIKLAASLDAGTTVYQRTYCSKKALFVCLQKSREYCVFNSRIAREVSLQGLTQLYGTFECRGIEQEELELIDWSLIDLSNVFGDMFANISADSEADLTNVIQGNILLSTPGVQNVYD